MWKIRIGNKVLPEVYEGTTQAVQEFMRSEQRNAVGGDSIKEFGVFVVETQTFESYQLAYPGQHDKARHQIPTCGGGIILRYMKQMQLDLQAEQREHAELNAWMAERERWASVSIKFDSNHVYVHHYVVFYEPRIGWVHAKPGNGYNEAIRNAMGMRFNFETQEYFDPL